MDILIVILALMGLGMIVFLSGAGAKSFLGSLASPSVPEGCRALRLREMSARHFLIVVENAMYMSRWDKYCANVRCPLTGECEHLEARSQEELERLVGEAFVRLGRQVDKREAAASFRR